MTSSFWKNVPLSNVLIERKEKPSDEALATGATRIVSKISFNDGLIQLRQEAKTKTGMILIRPGDLVVSGINAAKGAIAIFDQKESEPIAATIHYGAYIPDSKQIDVRYLWWLLRSNTFRDLLNQYVPGGIKTELKAKRLLPIPVPIPPLHEQKRVVARIEFFAAKIDKANNIRGYVFKEIEALRRHAIDMVLSRASSARKSLEQLLAEPLINGISIPASKLGTGIVFAKVGIVNTGVFNPKEIKQADINLPPDSPYWLKQDDIVISRGNAPELVGRAAVYEGEPRDCAFPDLLIRARVKRNEVDPRFLAMFFHSSEARAYIESQISGTSSTMPKISQPKLMAMPIPIISIVEQRKIVAWLEKVKSKIDELVLWKEKCSVEFDALFPSILDKAFKGELL